MCGRLNCIFNVVIILIKSNCQIMAEYQIKILLVLRVIKLFRKCINMRFFNRAAKSDVICKRQSSGGWTQEKRFNYVDHSATGWTGYHSPKGECGLDDFLGCVGEA